MTTGGEENGRYGPGEGSVYDYAEPQQQHLGAEGSGPQPATPATPGGGRVESSLHGLVDELDKLRETLGYSNQLAVIEQHLHALQSENDELRSYAEEAIKEAERLANLNEELQSRLRQQELDEHMGAVLAETQKLRDVADEFEKDIVLQKLEEVEERVAEIEGLKGRVRELEEENVALTQTLNEYRESTEQLQRLRMMENAGSGEEGTGAGLGFGAAGVTAGAAAVTAAAVAAGRKSPVKQQRPQRGFSAPQENGTVLPGQQGGADFNRSATVPNSSSPRSHSASMGAALPPRAHAGSSRDPARLAEQLAAAAGGADVGVVASAAKCLRDYAALETALTHERQECERVRLEVEELRDTMFSKTFKPPSAWAEREVKYKMEKKAWEDKHKDLAQRLGEAEREVAEYRAAGKAAQWEERIHELEAQLLQTERQKDDARAQLHELQLSLRSISNSPEMQQRYSTYKPGAMQSDGGEGVLGVVAQLEQHRIGMDPPPGSQTPPRLGAEASHGSEVGASFSEQGEASPGRPKSDKLRALAQDRASADAAWEEHNKRSDVAGLRRSKAELETKVSMLEQQINKMQWAIEHADEQQAAIEEQLDTALKTGDVMNLTTIRDKIKAGLASPSKVFRRGKGGPSPNKAAMSKQLHQTTDALRSSEAEKNALRRQLAKLSRKYKEVVVAGAGATGGAAGAAAAAAAPGRGSEGAGASGSSDVQQQSRPASLDSARSSAASAGGGPAAAPAAAAPAAAAVSEEEAAVLAAVGTLGAIDEFDTEDVEEYYGPGVEDSEMEILALREENELLMDQLVTTKVRLAETEGDFLRSKRELLRAKEKRQELEERLAAAHQAQQQEQSQATLQPLGSGSVALPSPTQSVASLGTSFLAPEDSSLAAPALSREYSTGSVGGPGASMGTAGSMGAGAATSVSAGTSAGAAPGPLRAAAMGGGPLQAAMSGGGGLATAGDSGGAGNVQAPAPAPAAHRSSSWIRGLKF